MSWLVRGLVMVEVVEVGGGCGGGSVMLFMLWLCS